ncbi:MAG: hypothetical protein ACKV2Q_24335 [Planctomycetaceae bacterium]
MQTVVLGTAATQRPLEEFLQNLGEEVEVIDAAGNVRFHVLPTSSAYDRQFQEKVYRLFEADVLANMDELKRRSTRRENGVTTKELLEYLNSLPCPSE